MDGFASISSYLKRAINVPVKTYKITNNLEKGYLGIVVIEKIYEGDIGFCPTSPS
jgi:hypothetical protein